MLSSLRKASKKILRDFHELRFLQSSQKPLNKFLKFTIAHAEESIFEALHHARPEFGLVSHYSDYEKKAGLANYWIVNVLDGIENFARAIPYFAISIAVQQKDKDGNMEFVAGAIHIPALGELYFAEKGNGAWCEFSEEFQAGVSETRLRVPEKSSTQPIIFTNNIHEEAGSLTRILGSDSVALAYLASGRGDKSILNYDNLSDLAAGIIIAKEAGAVVKDDPDLKRLIATKAA
jgi:myo-inositol-1(or 4)-monophosphatase